MWVECLDPKQKKEKKRKQELGNDWEPSHVATVHNSSSITLVGRRQPPQTRVILLFLRHLAPEIQ